MIGIGRYRIGAIAFSAFILFIVLTICAVFSAIDEYSDMSPAPLWFYITANETMALAVTLAYGISAHFVMAAIDYFRKKRT